MLALFSGMDDFLIILCDGAVVFLMSAIVFANSKTSFFTLLKCTAVGVLTSMILSGVMTALYSLFNRIRLPLDNTQENSASILVFAIIAALAGVATVQGGRFLGLSKKSEYVTVNAVLFGKSVTLRAMVDTGNHLREPISGRSVIVADKTRILALLPPSLSKDLQSPCAEKWLSQRRYATQIRLVPTNTATGTGMLPAILPDKLTLTSGKETYAADYLIAPAPMENNSDFDAVIAIH